MIGKINVIIYIRVILILFVAFNFSGCFDVIQKTNIHNGKNISHESSIRLKGDLLGLYELAGKFGLNNINNVGKTCNAESNAATSWWSGLIAGIKKIINRIISFITSRYDSSMLEERDGLVFLIGSDDPFTGHMINQYINGQDKNYIEYKDGLVFGKWKEWYKNGKDKTSGVLVEGTGIIKYFDVDGKKRKESDYVDGLLKTTKEYSPVGQLLGKTGKFGIPLDTEYNVVGTLEKNSKKECKKLVKKVFKNPDEFIDDWNKVIETHEVKSDHVSLIYNYANGNVCAIFPLDKGQITGAHFHYLPNGDLFKFIRYKEGEIYGEYATYLVKKNECYIGDNTSGAFGGNWKGTCNRIIE
jgi:antitoxin component YwqK of YwqJK toxin-antitoxin module